MYCRWLYMLADDYDAFAYVTPKFSSKLENSTGKYTQTKLTIKFIKSCDIDFPVRQHFNTLGPTQKNQKTAGT